MVRYDSGESVGEGKTKSFLKRLFSGGSGGCSCSGPAIVGSRYVSIEGSIVSIKGLDETFRKCRDAGKKPDDLTGYELLKTLEKMNRIDELKREAYREALLREYRRHCESKKER
jgi:hypothetical protein